MKTLAIRLEDELHARLSMLAQLQGITIADAIRQSIEGYVAQQRDDLSGRATEALEEIEREANARRAAIQSLLGGGTTPTEPTPIRGSRKRGSSEPTA